MVIAHTSNDDGDRHDLVDHLRAVAEGAREFARSFDAGEVAYWLGYWHDVGKACMGFQDYLQAHEDGHGPPRGPDHKMAGAVLAWDHLTALRLLAVVIQGHHSGMESEAGLLALLDARRGSEDIVAAHRWAQQHLAVPPEAVPVPDWVRAGARDGHLCTVEMFLRMCLAAMVDADHLDTEAHFNPGEAAVRSPAGRADALLPRFDTYYTDLRARGRAHAAPEVIASREAWRHACDAAAIEPPGMFRLPAPTGTGKTMAAMSFALRHAREHNLRRVIVAVPYITITQQTAAEYRAAFGDDVVLEHHSGIFDPDNAGHDERAEMRRRLTTQNWDAEVVVTTMVQVLESLHSNRPSKVRKLHRIAKSVVVLDEVQSLPVAMLDPTMATLRELVDHYGVTVVLSTATQPTFEVLEPLQGLDATTIRPAEHAEPPVRVRSVRRDGSVEWSEIAAEIAAHDQVLVVVNTRRNARDLTFEVPDATHLSTLLCARHRADRVEEIRRRLGAGEPLRLVSTQVIEAGVDLDFPVGYRAWAPLDSIIQVAGRVNRGGRLPEPGTLTVFDPAEGRYPDDYYARAAAAAQRFWRGDRQPDDPAVLRRYYRQLLRRNNTDRKDIQPFRAYGEIDFPEISRRYRLIDDLSVDVLVPTYEPDDRMDFWLALLRGETTVEQIFRSTLRAMQPWTVSIIGHYDQERGVWSGDVAYGLEQGLLEPTALDGLFIWRGTYDPNTGIEDILRDQEEPL